MRFFDRLSNLVSGLGTGKDKASHNVFGLRLLMPAELIAMHRSDWLSRKIVDIIPHDMTREWRDWQAKNSQIERIEEAERALGVRQKVAEAIQRARLQGGAGIYIGTDDQDVGQPLAVEQAGVGAIRYLSVLGRDEITCGEMDRDVLSPFFGQPIYYELRGSAKQVRIHPSRMVRFIGAPIFERTVAEQDGWGDSVLQVVYDAVQNAAASQQHVAGLIAEAKVDVIKVPGLSETLKTTGGAQLLTQRFMLMNQLKSTINAVLLEGDGESGETWQQKTINFTRFPELLQMFLQVAAGAADIPVTRLLGQSPAGLNSTGESDLRNYYDNIASRQNLELRPALAPLDEMLIRHALGRRPASIHYEWAPLWQMDEAQKAEIASKKATATKTYADTGLIPRDALAKATVNQLIEDGTYPGLEDAVKASPEEPGDQPALGTPEKPDPAATKVADAAPRTLYVKRPVKNAAAILAWAKAQGFETTLKASDLHVTIAYSRAAVDWMKIGEAWTSELKLPAGGPRLVDRFGKATVLLFRSGDLEWRHEAIKEAGATWDHPEYQPHITITYGDSRDLREIEPYRGEIVLGPEIFAEIDEDWQGKVEET